MSIKLEVRVLTLDKKVARQLPQVSSMSLRREDKVEFLGNIAQDAIERGSDSFLLVRVNGGETSLMRRTYSEWETKNQGPRIILA